MIDATSAGWENSLSSYRTNYHIKTRRGVPTWACGHCSYYCFFTKSSYFLLSHTILFSILFFKIGIQKS